MIGVNKKKTLVVPYDNNWENEYIDIKNRLLEILGENVLEIHHIGSTAVKGISAKPIMDINVVIKNKELLNINGMEDAGYFYRGEFKVFGHLFEYIKDDNLVTQNIKCYLEGNVFHKNVLLFCNFLKENPEYAGQYKEKDIMKNKSHVVFFLVIIFLPSVLTAQNSPLNRITPEPANYACSIINWQEIGSSLQRASIGSGFLYT